MKQIVDLEPRIIWNYFHEVTRIPRPSKKEEKIVQYLEAFAAQQGLACKKDAANNVLISKPATPGYEKLPVTILQSHVDMVAEKNSNVTHNFENDPIETYIDGDWVRAKGTTLGADNGIGVAAQLAILAANNLAHGSIECLFTVDEETGLTGAQALEPGFMTGRLLLNLDSEDEGEMFIGCAGGKNTTATFTYQPQATPAHLQYFRIQVLGLNGGHSGCDIHKGLGNANKILARFLYILKKDYPLVLATIDGGNLHNAIAREAFADIGIESHAREKVRILLNEFAAAVELEYKRVDAGLRLTMETIEQPSCCMPEDVAERLINALLACPHGVIGMSHDIEGLVETSTNLASVKTIENHTIRIVTSQRSAIDSAKKAVADQVAACFRLAQAEVQTGDGYPGWTPNPDSKLLQAAQATYHQLYGKDPKIMAIHAGLECGLFLEKYPYLDMISFGPTLREVHSPNERIHIPSVALWWDHLILLLKNIPQ